LEYSKLEVTVQYYVTGVCQADAHIFIMPMPVVSNEVTGDVVMCAVHFKTFLSLKTMDIF